MEDHTTTDHHNGLRQAAGTYPGITGRLLSYFQNGQAFYWASFFTLILIEFFLGGQLSKTLTRENYSLYANVLNTLPFYNVLVNLGLSYSIIYIISYNKEIRYRLFRQALQVQVLWYLLVVGMHLLVFAFFRSSLTTSLLITSVITLAYSYRLNMNSLFLATRAYKKAALSNALQKISLVIIFLIVYHAHTFTQALNGQFVVLYPAIELSVVLLYLIIFSTTNIAVMNAHKVSYRKRLFKYSKYAMFNNGLNLFNFTIITFIIHSSHTDIHVQIIFLLCIVFFRYAGVAIAPILPIMNPIITAIKNDRTGVKRVYRKYYLFILLIGLATLAACKLFFGYVITHFYAAEYHELPSYFDLLCYFLPFSFINSLNASVIAAMGKIKYTFRVEVTCTTILLLFLAYNLLQPISDYGIFYYIVLTPLLVKFLLQSYGAYAAVYKR